MNRRSLHRRNFLLHLQDWPGYDQPVLLKEAAHQPPNRSHLDQLHNEYTIITQLADVPGVRLVLAKEGTESKPVLLLQYVEGHSLAELIQSASLDLPEKLRIAVDVAGILSRIHAEKVMHKDINSSNILVADDDAPRSRGSVYITDFGLASTMRQEISSPLKTDDTLFGTLAYISPEQTGRMNRPVDYRTDLYSLGVTLYQLFTAQLPFQSSDPLEIIHSHIARLPTPPAEVNSDVPAPVSAIILKLMAKNPEDRYQTACGLQADLQHCLDQYQAAGQIESFGLGRDDFSGRLRIPAKLYGRGAEITQLLETFERVMGGRAELLLVTGYAGVGKTSLVNELQRSVTEKRGYFIEGKFDQYQRSIPYSAWGQAFAQLVNLWLAESQASLNAWKAIMLEAVGPNGQVLIDLFPNLEYIIGPQPAVPELGAVEAKNRFQYLFQQFISAVASPDHPLVVFLDDLQWIDLASLKLFDILLSDPNSECFMVIGAYRDNQVDASHPLRLELSHLKERERPTNQLRLDNLNLEQVNTLLSDSLKMPPDQCLPLARLIQAKTDGNAFFTRELLHTLADDGLLSFDSQARHWQWDISRLNNLAITKNVVELMIDKMQRLPAACQEILQVAACLGTRFDLTLLRLVSGKSQEKTRLALQASYETGFIIQVNGSGQFAHDRIQQAAYALIPDQNKPQLHRHIGRMLLAETPTQPQDDRLLNIVGHLNKGEALIEEAAERLELAELNAQAAEFALQTTAFAAVLDYAGTAIHLLGDDGWQSHYDLMLRLHLLVAEAAFLNTDYDLSEQTIDTILTSARSDLDKASAYLIRIESLNTQHQLQAAIEAGLSALQMLGVPLQETLPSDLTLEILQDLPVMSLRRELIATEILAACIHPVYVSRPKLLPAIVITTLHLTKTHGLTPAGCLAIVSYATLFVWRDDIEAAYQLGSLGLQLIERLDDKRYLCQVNTAFDSFLLPWKAHLTEVKSRVQATIQIGFETGNKSYLGTSLLTDTALNATVGNSLAHAQNAMERNLRQLEKLRVRYRSYNAYIWTQYVAHLRGTTKESTKFAGPYFVEETDLPTAMADKLNNTSLAFHSLKSSLHYHLGDYRAAYAHSRQAEPYASPAISNIIQYLLPFYQSLALLQFPERQTEHLEKLDKNIDMLRLWAEHAPMNCQHKLAIVLAERERAAGNIGAAIDHYEQAIAEAKNNGFLQDEALANELYGRFWHERGNDKIAQLYLREAHALYWHWGAGAIVAHLEERYPRWLNSDVIETGGSTPATNVIETHGSLVVNSVLKTAEVIAGELSLEKLLQTLMTILIQNAGAQRAYLIAERDDQWLIEAEGDVNADEIRVLQNISIEDNDQVSANIIHYVARTRQMVLLADAASAGQFRQDPTIQRRQVKSVLSVPLINRGQLSGILYLENNLAPGVFTSERVELLKLLSSQMAISIDHARLYDLLEEKVVERTRALTFAQEQIRTLFEDSQVGISLATLEGQMLTANEALMLMTGYSERELLERNVIDFYVDPEQRHELLAQLAAEVTVHNFGVTFKRKDGSPFFASLNVSQLIRDGQVVLLAIIEDVTEQQRAQEKLRFQAQLLETVQQAVIVTDLSGHVVYWNSAAERLYGWTAEEAMGRMTNELMLDNYDQQPIPEIRAHFLAGKSWTGEFPARRRDGTTLPIESTVTPVFSASGELAHVIGVSSDITERKQAEEALQRSEESYRGLVEKISDVIYAVDVGGVITYLNPAVEALIGLPPEQVIGHPFAQFIHPEDLGRLQDNFQTLLTGVVPGPAEYRVLTVKGETRWIRVTSQPVVDGGRVTGVHGVLSDITERKRVESQLEEAATTAERQRLARELHDSVTQSLFSLDLFANAIRQALAAGRIERATDHAEQILGLSQSALADMRLLIFELRPSLLDQVGLVGALQARLESVETRAGFKTKIEVQAERPLPSAVETELYAVAIEALNNTLKHAQADQVTINLEYDKRRCSLTIRDDGLGFDPEIAMKGGGFGLQTMTERVKLIGGTMTLESSPGKGTTVSIEVAA